MELWGRVAPLLTSWCSNGDVPSVVNLSQYAVWGSPIPWHSDNEPLFGKRDDLKVIVSNEARVRRGRQGCRRRSRNTPSPTLLDHSYLLVMGWV